jgi:NDP-sugar pyrophosphorylase family protein
LRAREPVGALRFDGLWFDIGRRDDYEQAVAAWLEASAQNGNGNGNGHGSLEELGGELLRKTTGAGQQTTREELRGT